jgi:hypothetical protein
LNLKLDRAPISERGVEPTFVVDLVDEVRKRRIRVARTVLFRRADLVSSLALSRSSPKFAPLWSC